MKIKAKNVCALAAVVLGLALLYYFLGRKLISGFENESTFTLYYADWCPHCKDVKPVFEKWMASKGGSIQANGKTVKLAIVEESSMPAGTNVKGFPTFKLGNKECDAARNPGAWEQWLNANA